MDGVVGPKTKHALRTAHIEDSQEKEARSMLKPAAGATIKWRLLKGTVPPSLGDKATVAAELAKAFATWGEAMGGVTFEETGVKGAEQLTLLFDDRTPQNTMAFDGPGGALAAASKPGSLQVAGASASSITFDSAERWELSASGAPAHPQRGMVSDMYFFKLLPVAIHEIGHLLGLGHSNEPADVMSPYYSPEKVTLSANDKKRIAGLLSSVNA